MTKGRFIAAGVVLALCYVSGPIVAAAFRFGDRLGPAFYPESFHEMVYIMAYESMHDEKPRVPIDSWMYWRPLFYGFSRRLKSEKDREAYLDMVRRNESPILERMIEMNDRVRHKTVQGTGASRSAQETNQPP